MKLESISSGSGGLRILILSVGVFGIINTEMGVVGILPLIAETFGVTVPRAGWLVSAFALVVAVSGPVAPLIFSGMNRKKAMLTVLGVFTVGNVASAFAESFGMVLASRIVCAFFHPVYVSMAFTVAAESVAAKDAPKAVSKIFIGVSAGMVLGVPVTNYVAGETSFSAAMAFFALVTASVFAATLFFMPELPVAEKPSRRSQLGVLKRSAVWFAIAAFVCVNGAMFGFFSYLSDYMKNVTGLGFKTVSAVLFVYGIANIAGNVAAGRLLSWNAGKTVAAMPFLMGAVYALLFAFGSSSVAAFLAVMVLGVLAGVASNAGQHMISSSACGAAGFANGLFLTSANLGTALGTAVCGLFISGMGTRYSIMGALAFLAVGGVFVFLWKRGEDVFARRDGK